MMVVYVALHAVSAPFEPTVCAREYDTPEFHESTREYETPEFNESSFEISRNFPKPQQSQKSERLEVRSNLNLGKSRKNLG